MSNDFTNWGQRIVHYRFGDPQEVLRVEKAIVGRPLLKGEVLVRVSHSVIHPGDLQLVAARYSQGGEIPQGRVPGFEATGIVQDAARGALDGTGLSIGKRVSFFSPGAWQKHAIVAADSLIAIPADLPDNLAAQVLVNTITARHVLRKGLDGLSPRALPILQTGASSAVGKLITRLALCDGLDPIRLVRSSESADRLARVLPGGHIVDTTVPGWQALVRELTKDNLRLALDGVGGPMVGEISALLGTNGRMISYGLLDGRPAELTLFVPKALSLMGVTIGTWRADTTPEERAQDMKSAIEFGITAPEIFAGLHEFDLAELPAAISAVTAPGKSGNVILKF
jgi:NADPH:quinone reductase-like Zn-dependent oxidoreductase